MKRIAIFFILVLLLGVSTASASFGSGNFTRSHWSNHKNIPLRSFNDDSGCCSVILHVNNTNAVFAYRRDSTYAATLNIQKTIWYGRKTLREYKTTNGYFFHALIMEGGWMTGTGGPDIVWINRALENLGGEIVKKGKIINTDMGKAYSLVKKMGLGHFVIKGPDGTVGVAIYRWGYSKLSIFKMKPGEYISVPNSPSYYRKGRYSTWSSNPVKAAIYVAGTDRWGYNRRNIITYNITVGKNSTKLKVYATFDGGRLLGRNYGRPDNIVFLGKFISASSIPRIPSAKLLGTVTFTKTS